MSTVATLANLKQKQVLLRIMVFTLVTVMAWVIFGLLHSQTKTTLPPELSALSQPLNPNLDQTVFDKIQQKRSISAQELSSFPIYVITTDANGRTTNAVLSGNDSSVVTSTSPSPSAQPSPEVVPTR
jgi:hypothetical protein